MDFSSFAAGDTGVLAGGLLIAGAVAGLAAGTLRMGGGLVLVPALYISMRNFGMPDAERLPVAIATALAAAFPATLSLVHDFWRKDLIDRAYFRRWGWVAGIAALLGGVAAGWTPTVIGMAAFALAALTGLALLLFWRETWVWPAATSSGFFGGLFPSVFSLIAVFSGVGVAPFLGPYLKLGDSDRTRAQATTLAFEAVVLLAGTAAMIVCGLAAGGLPRYSLGYVNLASFAVAAPVMFLAATFVQAHAEPQRKRALQVIFALLVVLSAAKMLMDWLG